jgi:uncharacterized protein YciI
MLFALLCTDKPGALQLRLVTRPEHVAYLTKLNEEGKLAFAGPFLDADGKPNGSLVVLKADSVEAARALGEADPYAKAGVFASVEVKPWTWTFNNPEA